MAGTLLEEDVARGYLIFEHYAYTPRTKKWHVKSRSDGSLLCDIEWHAPWRGYCFSVTDVKPTEKLWFSIGCMRTILEFCEEQMKAWRSIENMGTEQCPNCKSFMQVGRKEAYARKQNGDTVIIYLVTKYCPKCHHTEGEDYKDRVKAMGLKPY